MKKRNPFASNLFSTEKGQSPSDDMRGGGKQHMDSYADMGSMTLDDLLENTPVEEQQVPFGGYTVPNGQDPAAPGAVNIDDETLAVMCKARICPDCPVKKEADDAHLRALADLENARKRLTRESAEQVRFAAEKVLSDIIPSLDNLDLALQHAGDGGGGKDFVTGVRMTRNMMIESLKKHGLQEVGGVGEEFNPAVHEAVGLTAAADVPNGHVCALLAHGYTLNGRLLRPARVIVCKK